MSYFSFRAEKPGSGQSPDNKLYRLTEHRTWSAPHFNRSTFEQKSHRQHSHSTACCDPPVWNKYIHPQSTGLSFLSEHICSSPLIKYSFLSPRLWRCHEWLRGQFQFPKPPWLLPLKLTLRLGDPGPTATPGSDPCFLPGGGGTLPLSVWLVGGSAAGRADLSVHQVGQVAGRMKI